MALRYLFLDSTHRDRTQYANPAHFAVGTESLKENRKYFQTKTVRNNFGNTTDRVVNREYDKIVSIRDLILNDVVALGTGSFSAASENPGILAGVVSNNEIQLDAIQASDIDGFYNGVLITMTGGAAAGESVIITNYENNGGNHDADLASSFIGVIAPGDSYVLRKIISLDLTASNTDDEPNYVGQYIRIDSGAGTGQYAQIIRYDGALKLAIISSPWEAPIITGPAALDNYTIHKPKDNFHWLEYAKTQVTQPMCYTVKLCHLTLPFDATLNNGRYLAVELRATNSRNTHTIISNNHDIGNAQFIVPLDDNNSNINFLQLRNSNMYQTIKFKPDDILLFRIMWPDGTELVLGPDTASPLDPDPSIQVNVLFELKPMPMHSAMPK